MVWLLYFFSFRPRNSGQPSRRPEDACNSPNFDAHATDSITLVGKSLIARIFQVFVGVDRVQFRVNLFKTNTRAYVATVEGVSGVQCLQMERSMNTNRRVVRNLVSQRVFSCSVYFPSRF